MDKEKLDQIRSRVQKRKDTDSNEVTSTDKDISSIILIVWVCIRFFVNTAMAIIRNEYITRGTRIIMFCSAILVTLSNILPALAIKNKTLKIIGIILVSMIAIYVIYREIESLSMFFDVLNK